MKRTRNPWTAAAEELFIEIWRQKINDLRGPRKNSHVHKEMAAEMQKQGDYIDHISVKAKIDNLTAKYRKCKEEIGTTGGSPATWPLYETVHQIIGGFCVNNVEELIEESYEELIIERAPSSLASQSTPTSPSPSAVFPQSPPPEELPSTSSSFTRERPRKKREVDRLVNVCEKMQQSFEKTMNNFHESNDKLIELENNKVLAVQELQKDTKRLTDGVLDCLKDFNKQ